MSLASMVLRCSCGSSALHAGWRSHISTAMFLTHFLMLCFNQRKLCEWSAELSYVQQAARKNILYRL